MSPDLKNRRGVFHITRRALDIMPDEHLLRIFTQVVVQQVDYDVYSDSVTYFAASPAFDVLAEGSMAPAYIAYNDRDEHGIETVSWGKA